MRRPSKSLEERFWAKVDKENGPTMPHMESRCWLWTGALKVAELKGYGLIWSGVDNPRPRMLRAHRVSFELAYGPLPEGICACHKCDGPSFGVACVRPDHLFPGTPGENMMDAYLKGRMASGERGGKAKLTALDVEEIRARLMRGVPQRKIADDFGVTRGTINSINTKKNWSGLPRAPRGGPRTGEANPSAKLTEQQVVVMRREYAAGRSAANLGARYGISKYAALQVVRGKTWAAAGGPIASRETRSRRRSFRKLTFAGAEAIRRLRKEGVAASVIAADFNISASMVYFIIAGRKWRNAADAQIEFTSSS